MTKNSLPEYLVYQEIYQTDQKQLDGEIKTITYLKGVTRVDDISWLNKLGTDLLIKKSKPVHEFSS